MVTIICMDTSMWMGHHTSDKFLGQIDAIRVYCEKYLESYPENYVGVLTMGGEDPYAEDPCVFTNHTCLVVEPTKDLSLIMSRLRGFVNVRGDTLLVPALMTGSFHLLEHENLLKRLVVFAGGPLGDNDNQYTKLGTKLKERGVAVDIVNFGAKQAGYKKHQLLVLLAAVNNNDNTRMLDLCGNQLNGSSIIPLVGQGETSLYAVYLLQGEYLQKAKNQCDKVHGDSNVGIGYFFRKQIRFEGRERYRVGDRRKVREWDIGKDIPLDDDDAGKDRYWDRDDRYGRKRDYRVRDDRRERYKVGDRRKLKRDDDAGKERYWDRGDGFHDLKPDGGNDDTWNRKRKRDDRGHDDGRERYRDRGDSFHDLKPDGGNDDAWNRKRIRDDRGHDDERERSFHDLNPDGGNDDTWNRKRKRDDRGHDDGRERYWDRSDSFHDLKPDEGNDDTWNRKTKRDDRGHDDGRERYRD